MLTHHFAETEDRSIKSGWWAGHYGEKLCTWMWDSETKILEVRCGDRVDRVPVVRFDGYAQLRKDLPLLAREAAERLRGEKFKE
jgi:hypothetical protein